MTAKAHNRGSLDSCVGWRFKRLRPWNWGSIDISKDFYLPFMARLCFKCTNNIIEYEACIMGIKVVIDLRIKILEVYEDFALVINQIQGEWETCHPKLITYRTHGLQLITHFE